MKDCRYCGGAGFFRLGVQGQEKTPCPTCYPEIIAFLKSKLAETEKALHCREDMRGASNGRIAERLRKDVELFRAAIELVKL